MHICLFTPHFFWNTYSPQYKLCTTLYIDSWINQNIIMVKKLCVELSNIIYAAVHSRDYITPSRLDNSSPFWWQRRTNLHPNTPRHARTFHLPRIHTPSWPPSLHPPPLARQQGSQLPLSPSSNHSSLPMSLGRVCQFESTLPFPLLLRGPRG